MKRTPGGHLVCRASVSANSHTARNCTPLSAPLVGDSVQFVTNLDPYLSLKALAAASGLSVRNLRARLADPARPLPHYRVDGKILVRWSQFNSWMAHFQCNGAPLEIETIVNDAVKGLVP